jgi:hypothetical protein
MHADFEELLRAVISFAQFQLADGAAIYPFGASMSPAGEVGINAADAGRDKPPAQELVDMMTMGYRQLAAGGKIRAACLCVDVFSIPPGKTAKSDANGVMLEHSSGDAIEAYVPYKRGWFGKLRYGEMYTFPREPQFFVRSGE